MPKTTERGVGLLHGFVSAFSVIKLHFYLPYIVFTLLVCLPCFNREGIFFSNGDICQVFNSSMTTFRNASMFRHSVPTAQRVFGRMPPHQWSSPRMTPIYASRFALPRGANAPMCRSKHPVQSACRRDKNVAGTSSQTPQSGGKKRLTNLFAWSED